MDPRGAPANDAPQSPRGDSPGLPSTIAYTIDPFNGSVIGGKFNPPVPGGIQGSTFDPVSGSLYVGDGGGSDVYVFNGSAGSGVAAIYTGPNPNGGSNGVVAVEEVPGANAVYATNGNAGNVAVINISTNRLTRTIGVGCGPESLSFAPTTGWLYVGNFCGTNLTLVNTSTDQTLPTSFPVCGNPSAVLWSPVHDELFVSCVSTEEVLVLNASSGKILKHLSLGGVNAYPVAMAFDPYNGDVYVANEGLSNVSIINCSSNTFVGPGISTNGLSPDALLVDPGLHGVLVGTLPEGLSLIDDRNNTLTSTRIATGDTPVSLSLDSSDGLVYVVNQGTVTLTQVSATTGTVLHASIPLMFRMLRATYDPVNGQTYVATPDANFACIEAGSLLVVNSSEALPRMTAPVSVGLGPEAVAVDPSTGRLFVPNLCSNTVSAVNGSTNAPIINSLPAGLGPIAAAVDPNDGRVFVANGYSDNVTVLNTSTLANIFPNVTVGTNPDAVAVDPGAGMAYVANFGSNNVSRINASTGAVVPPAIPVGGQPEALLYDPFTGRVYVANSGSGNVTVLNGSTGAIVAPGIAVGSGPVAMSLDPVTDCIFIADANSGEISVLNATTDTLAGSPVAVGPDPQGVAFDPVRRALFVSDYASGAILVLANVPTGVRLSANPNPAEVGVPLTVDTQITTGPTPFTYAYSGLPPGCAAVNASVVACQPSHAGSFLVQVLVTGVGGGFGNIASLSLTVGERPQILAARANPSVIELGLSTAIAVNWSGGEGNVVLSYSGLPPGCPGTNSSGLPCRPTSAGSYSILVWATDAYNATAAAAIGLLVVPRLSIAAFFAQPDPVDEGVGVSIVAIPTLGLPPYSYSYSGLPPGCVSSNASTLACTPGLAGNYTVESEVTDTAGVVAFANASLEVISNLSTPPGIVAFWADPSNLTLGTSVQFDVVLSGGASPFAFDYTGLPPGCVGGFGQTFRCTPNGTGTFTIRVTASDSLGRNASSSILVTVNTPSQPVNPNSPWGVTGFLWTAAIIGSVAMGLLIGAGASHLRYRSRHQTEVATTSSSPGSPETENRPPLNP